MSGYKRGHSSKTYLDPVDMPYAQVGTNPFDTELTAQVSTIPKGTCLSSYFELTCERSPDNIAVLCGSSRVTYRELDGLANQMARFLVSRGVTPASPVGILLERSIDAYVALLGILKVGAAFVPLDPSIPSDRLTFIAKDAGLVYLITNSSFREKTGYLSCPSCEFDLIRAEIAGQIDSRLDVSVDSSSLCYIIYTSGSTGQPKGVAISLVNITNYLRVVIPLYGVTSADRVYQGITLAFDFSLEEIWSSWLAGATLVAGPTDSRRLGQSLGDFLTEQGITVFYCVPTLLSTIEHDIPSIRTLVVGAEVLPPDLVRRWSRPERRMYNTYGPTETTITATWCEVFPDRPVTIGKPLPTYYVTILDDQLRPVNEGECGEICVGGPGVALGYINRPELTRERFILDPLRQASEEAPRLYRTGDLGRFTPSGEIEYLGRIDTQVKIRGYRVELGEIENILCEHQAVQQAVVVTHEVDGVVRDLYAYVTHYNGISTAQDDRLREQLYTALHNRLPAYMVPSFIEILDAMPLLASGKVDRKALPPSISSRLGVRSTGCILPSTSLERELAIVWSQVLCQEQISVEDDFFCDLGGHSLAAALVVSKLRQKSQFQTLAISDLYDYSTIRRLATYITTCMTVSVSQPLSTHMQALRPAPQRSSTLQVLRCGIIQFVALYAILLIFCMPLWHTATLFHASFFPIIASITTELIWVGGVSCFLPIIGGRWLIRGIKPGSYPLWGTIYFRWWLYRKILALSPLALLTGSPLISPYLRLLGASVGKGCHLASIQFGLPTFITLEDGVSVGYGVHLQPFVVEAGWLRLAPIHIGQDAFIGTNSFILAGAQVGQNTFIGEQSLVPQDHIVPAHEHWGGSPVKRLEAIPPMLGAMDAKTCDRDWPVLVLLGFVLGVFLLLLFPVMAVVPSIALIYEVVIHAGFVWGMATTFLAGPLFVLVTCTLVLLGKRIMLPVVRPGIYTLRSNFGLRKWFCDQLMVFSLATTNTLYATLYLIPWLRLLGARIGRWSEVSTVAHMDPDMVVLGQECFVADIAVVGPAIFHHGHLALAPVVVGPRSFVGNGACIPGSSYLEESSLIGVHSVPPPHEVKAGSAWLGSPAIFLPRRQVSQHFDEDLTYRPKPSLVAWRLGIEYFRVTLPATILALSVLSDFIVTEFLATVLSWPVFLALMPLMLIGVGIVSTCTVVLLKWLIVGRYRPRVEPLWSVFARRTELVTGLYETVAVPSLLNLLTGTPWIAPFFRLLGAKIGRHVWLDTTYMTEFDLVEIGDDVAVGAMTSLQTHLFEDRVMKMSTIKIGAASSVGSRSVILYDTEIGDDASLDALSLLMKGETLPPESYWRGIPARHK